MEKNIKFDMGYALIRVLSTFVIVSYHYSQYLCDIGYSGYTNFFNKGEANLAVAIFFILSGATLYLNNKTIKLDYFKKRFLSIFPFFWFCYLPLAIIRCISFHSVTLDKNPIKYLLSIIGLDGYFLYLSPNYYLIGEWFLGALILLYILYPLIILILNRWKAASFVLFVLFLIGYIFVINVDVFKVAKTRNIIYCLFYFYLGILFERYKKTETSRYTYFFIPVIVSYYILIHFVSNISIILLLYVPIVCSIFVFLYFFCHNSFQLLEQDNWINKAIKIFSNTSFSVFLVHHIIIYKITTLLIRFIKNSFIVFVFEFIVIEVIAFSAYYIYKFLMNFLMEERNK